jgi:cell fate (sporulation/competence/biofilm development) regulator YlbF (YheA/YmcA/DUF963 family)
MEKVLNQAELLAEAILESQEYIRMRLSEQAATKDPEATRLVADYNEKRSKVQDLLASNDLDHGALARAGEELEAVEAALEASPLLKTMRDARREYSDMMDKVNAIIQFVITGEEPEEAGGCGGSCSSCGGGCHH